MADKKHELQYAKKQADEIVAMLEPYCDRIEIAGSIRRQRESVKDIEIVCIPKPYETGLFESGIATVVNKWKKVKGELPCKYTQRILPGGMKLDLFFAKPENWGLIFAIRTGSADYSFKVLATGWKRKGYRSENGMLTGRGDVIIPVRTEAELFRIAGVKWTEPQLREVQ